MCETVSLGRSQVLHQQGRPAQHAYFPCGGSISLVGRCEGHADLEVARVGREGMVGLQFAVGVATSPLGAQVQQAGTARRIAGGALLQELRASPQLARGLAGCFVALLAQLGAAAACVRFHLVEPRLARWLLMSHDHCDTDSFPVTHQAMASMLGVRRVGVTMAAGALQHRGCIRYHRGELTVIDRRGLEAAACSCYASDRHACAGCMG